jgi:hypothetical protein
VVILICILFSNRITRIMAVINAKVDDDLVKQFRHVIYERHGLKKGDFKNALEEAIVDYIRKYSQQIKASSDMDDSVASL